MERLQGFLSEPGFVGLKDLLDLFFCKLFSGRDKEPVLPPAEPEDVKALKRELAQAKLKNELLEEMLRLSEEHAGIDFRKKFGSGQ